MNRTVVFGCRWMPLTSQRPCSSSKDHIAGASGSSLAISPPARITFCQETGTKTATIQMFPQTRLKLENGPSLNGPFRYYEYLFSSYLSYRYAKYAPLFADHSFVSRVTITFHLKKHPIISDLEIMSYASNRHSSVWIMFLILMQCIRV